MPDYNRQHTQREIAEMQGCSFRAIQHVEERAIKKFIAGCEREAEAEGKSLREWVEECFLD